MLEFPTHKARSLGSLCFICKEQRRKKRLRAYNKKYWKRPGVKEKHDKQRADRKGDPKWRNKWRKYNQTWRAKNPEKMKAQGERYRARHREEIKERARKWYHAHKDKVKKYPSQSKEAKHAVYLKNKKELMRKQRERRAKRRAEKKA